MVKDIPNKLLLDALIFSWEKKMRMQNEKTYWKKNFMSLSIFALVDNAFEVYLSHLVD